MAQALVGVGKKTQNTRYERVKVSSVSAEISWLEEREYDERIGE